MLTTAGIVPRKCRKEVRRGRVPTNGVDYRESKSHRQLRSRSMGILSGPDWAKTLSDKFKGSER